MNAVFRLKYGTATWEVPEIIMLLKLSKQTNEVKYYWPVLLLPMKFTLLKKL